MAPLNVTEIRTPLGYQPTVTNWKTSGSRWTGSGGLKDEHILETPSPGSSIARPTLGGNGRSTMDSPTSAGSPMERLPHNEGRNSSRNITGDEFPDVVIHLGSLLPWSAIAVHLPWCLPLMWGGRS